MKVNLYPYKDFQDLAKNRVEDHSLVSKVDDKAKELERQRELKQAIYGPNIDMVDNDVMKSDSDSAVYARKFVKDLYRHVSFPDDEQRLIDDM